MAIPVDSSWYSHHFNSPDCHLLSESRGVKRGGGTELATLRGRALITEDGEAIEGEALDDITVAGVVTHTIIDVRSDSVAV